MIRTRIAPSPTGYLHIGTARTALFNYLFARRYGGQFVLRIEDTDLERSKPEYEKEIMEGLAWLGIHWDEGPDVGGEYGPYRQRERLATYRGYLEQLASQGQSYECFCTKEELEHERSLQELAKQPPRYTGKCRDVNASEREKYGIEGRTSVLRFRLPTKKLVVNDLIRGAIEFDTSLLDDFVIAKDLDTPLYNFAVVVDDYLMKITHVIRGEDHISNIPKQVLIDEALGFPIPQFAHLSMILNPDRTKLSKRKNKVSLLEFREEGYLPEALVNFMVLLGWNPGGEREIFDMAELEQLFSLEKVNKSGAVFDTTKLDWFNGDYMRTKSISDLTDLVLPFFETHGQLTVQSDGSIMSHDGESRSRAWLEAVVSLERERCKHLAEIPQNTGYFFTDAVELPREDLRWKSMTDEDISTSLDFSLAVLTDLAEDSFTAAALEVTLKAAITEKGLQNGAVLWPLRVALTGLRASPSPFDVAALLGKQKTLKRIQAARAAF